MTLIAQMEKNRQVSSTPFSNKMRVYPTIFYTFMEKGCPRTVIMLKVIIGSYSSALLDRNCRCFRAKEGQTTNVRVHDFSFHHTETP